MVRSPSDHIQAPKEVLTVGMEEGALAPPSSSAIPDLSTMQLQYHHSKNKEVPTKQSGKISKNMQHTEMHVEFIPFYVRKKEKLK